MRRGLASCLVLGLIGMGIASLGHASVITDWDEKAVALASVGSAGQREVALVHIAMFDAVNSIARRYRPYLVQELVKPGTSEDAAAASAAATVLKALHPHASATIDAALAQSLDKVSATGKADGVALGASVATKVLDARQSDGANAPDPFRLPTRPGAYVPTMTMVGAAWPAMQPFALRRASQFRPAAPISLESAEWTRDYREIRELGGKNSARRSAQQTEIARFWLMTGAPAYQPIARQLAVRERLDTIDSARFMALYSIALTDAYVSIFDAKYTYLFWRPLTAIRHADMDGNPDTQPEPAWQPIADTPMHPEYPCAHCIQSGAATGVIRAVLGTDDLTGIELTSTTLPAIRREWKLLADFNDEVENARIWAGFHYRFSARTGTSMGIEIGDFVSRNLLAPAAAN